MVILQNFEVTGFIMGRIPEKTKTLRRMIINIISLLMNEMNT